MPELPDVEVWRSYLAHTVMHKKITDIRMTGGRVFHSPQKDIMSLKNRSFEDTSRHGKYCFLDTDSKKTLVLHFGMTGNVKYYRDEDDPRHALLIVRFSDGHKFAFINIRKLGKVLVTEDKEKFIRENVPGPDALAISKKEFLKIMRAKRGKIKTALMDQKSIAGIGNIYADEILYHSGLDPGRKTGSLDEDSLKRIYEKMRSVLKTAVECKADVEKMPDNYLIKRRKKGLSCPQNKGKIKKRTIGGRSTYYCAEHQR
ncbi:MAG: DNA-formamidopyrimidine glycosylase family protein [Candidatus Marinimicrobia bacterium]|nr:DNA-formamidopyrimidine glycosylase family protein [Candidatus Neomarinimicrobiota bacterium]